MVHYDLFLWGDNNLWHSHTKIKPWEPVYLQVNMDKWLKRPVAVDPGGGKEPAVIKVIYNKGRLIICFVFIYLYYLLFLYILIFF